jgi:hypothetical protein
MLWLFQVIEKEKGDNNCLSKEVTAGRNSDTPSIFVLKFIFTNYNERWVDFVTTYLIIQFFFNVEQFYIIINSASK